MGKFSKFVFSCLYHTILGENIHSASPRLVPKNNKLELMLHNKGPAMANNDQNMAKKGPNKAKRPKRSASFKSFFRGSRLNLTVVDLGITLLTWYMSYLISIITLELLLHVP